MVTASETTPRISVGALAEGALTDVEKLIEQHFALFRTEVKEEFVKARGAAVSTGAGIGLMAVGGILGTLTVVHLLHGATKLPLWACYGLVAGTAGAAGATWLAEGVREARNLSLIPVHTAGQLKEDLQAVTPS